jgi:2-methylcitrate dehydratase PrpD
MTRTDHNPSEAVLASFVAEFSLGDAPPSVRARGIQSIRDTIGAMVGGATKEEVVRFAERSASVQPGPASVLGSNLKTSVDRAALVNGTAGTVLELDEGHKYAAGHPAIHVLPAVMAEAEATGGTGRELLEAFVVGYDVAARVGMATIPLKPAYHMHGIWGTVGAAAGVASYRDFDADATAHALRIGANHALHTHLATATEGATVRNTYAGMSNLNGLLAADQADAGFTGLQDGLTRHLGRVSQDGFDDAVCTSELGERWEIERGYFKHHAACRYTHGALDAIESIRSEDGVAPADIESILVETYPTAARLDDPNPSNSLQAKFSIPFAVATAFVQGHTAKSAFEPEAITAEALDLAGRVTVSTAPDLAERVPDARSTWVTVTLTDGRELTREIRHAKGNDENPISEAELETKFRTLVGPVVGEEQAELLWAAVGDLRETAPTEICELATDPDRTSAQK